MHSLTAFSARSEDAEDLAGSVAVGDGETFDFGEALEDGDGMIVVVAGSPLERSLDGVPDLKQHAAPDGATPVNPDDLPDEDVDATPAAVRKAQDLDVDLSEVSGTGSEGRITVDDVEAAATAETETAEGEES